MGDLRGKWYELWTIRIQMRPWFRFGLSYIGLSRNLWRISGIWKIICMWSRKLSILIDCTLLNDDGFPTFACWLHNYAIRNPDLIFYTVLLQLSIFLWETLRLMKDFLKIFGNQFFIYLLLYYLHDISHEIWLLFLACTLIERRWHNFQWRTFSIRMILTEILI